MKINHSDLIEVSHILGHASLGHQGVCHGFSVMLGQAFLVQEEGRFFDRLVLLESYKDNFPRLKQDIEQVNQKVINKQELNQNEKKLLEIPSLFDGIVLSQSPNIHRDVFAENYISQLNFEKTYPFIASIKLEEAEGPVSILSSTNYIFDLQETVSYFKELENNLRDNDSIIPIFLGNADHTCPSNKTA